MPKRRRLLSGILALWLFVMLIAFTYTWVSRNWTPSIKGDNINIASAGALVISVLGDEASSAYMLNDIVGLEVDNSFTFRQVSSQDGVTFFWKDFSPQISNPENPALFKRVGIEGDTHKKDYIEARFCLKLDETLKKDKFIFIHPDTKIEYTGDSIYKVNKAIRISLTFENEQGVETTVILADLGDGQGYAGDMVTDEYQAVANLPGDEFEETTPGALGYQTVYDLHYFDCGRTSFDYNIDYADPNYDPLNDPNYMFNRNAERALFSMAPGETVWITMRIWLEGQDYNCEKEIAGEKFDLFLKFDSARVTQN